MAAHRRISRVRLDPLALLRRGVVGNGAGDRICAALPQAHEVNATKTHSCGSHYRVDRFTHRHFTVDTGDDVIDTGGPQRLQPDAIGRAEYRELLSADLWRAPGMDRRSTGPLRVYQLRRDAGET